MLFPGVAAGRRAPSWPGMTIGIDDQTVPDTLDAVLAQAWGLLVRGAADRHHRFHTPVLATIGLDGAPEVRTVVLRAADRAERTLRVHSDRRAPKVAEIRADDRVSLAFYDPAEKVQVRVAGRADLHVDADPVARSAWAATSRFGRRCYLASAGPGTPASMPISGLPEELEGREPSWDATEAGLPNFVAIRICVTRLDWLHLAHTGHRRARFDWLAGNPPAATWCAP